MVCVAVFLSFFALESEFSVAAVDLVSSTHRSLLFPGLGFFPILSLVLLKVIYTF